MLILLNEVLSLTYFLVAIENAIIQRAILFPHGAIDNRNETESGILTYVLSVLIKSQVILT